MRVSLAVVAVESVKALLDRRPRCVGRAKPPFSERAGHIAGLFEDLGNRDRFVGDRPLPRENPTVAGIAIAANLRVRKVLSRHQRTSRRSTNWRTGVVLQKPHAVAGKRVNVRCQDFLLSVTTAFAVSEIVGKNENNVRAFGWRGIIIRGFPKAFICANSCPTVERNQKENNSQHSDAVGPEFFGIHESHLKPNSRFGALGSGPQMPERQGASPMAITLAPNGAAACSPRRQPWV